MFDEFVKDAHANGQTIFSQLGPEGEAAARAKLAADIVNWCAKEAAGQ